MEKIQTVLHAYWFDLSKEGKKAEYDAMVASIREGFKGRVWASDLTHGYAADKKAWDFYGAISDAVGKDRFGAANGAISIELETKNLFDDQWNSAPFGKFEKGARLFNWAEPKYANRHIKAGYWIEQTAEMGEVLRNRHSCGYCGKQEPAAKGYTFCPHCIGSEYLKPEDLKLTRMQGVIAERKYPELTDAEREHLMPLYLEAQITRKVASRSQWLAKEKASVEKQFNRAIETARIKHDAAQWLLSNVAPALYSNWIYYDHTGVHCFGWRKALSEEEVKALLNVISEFPYRYEIKCADGRTLSGER